MSISQTSVFFSHVRFPFSRISCVASGKPASLGSRGCAYVAPRSEPIADLQMLQSVHCLRNSVDPTQCRGRPTRRTCCSSKHLSIYSCVYRFCCTASCWPSMCEPTRLSCIAKVQNQQAASQSATYSFLLGSRFLANQTKHACCHRKCVVKGHAQTAFCDLPWQCLACCFNGSR